MREFLPPGKASAGMEHDARVMTTKWRRGVRGMREMGWKRMRRWGVRGMSDPESVDALQRCVAGRWLLRCVLGDDC